MSVFHYGTSGNKKVLPIDVGKPVRADTGETLGTIDAVTESGEFQVTLTQAGRAYLREHESAPPADRPAAYLPEDVEMVTRYAVWLR